MSHDIFISYSSKDKIVADAIVAFLEKNNIRCWYAPRDINPGSDWGEAIAQAVEECKLFLLIFSSHANNSQRVLDELNLAISKEVVILPFRIEKLDPSGAMLLHLSSRHWLDAFSPSWEKYLESLLHSVSSILEGKITEVNGKVIHTAKSLKRAPRKRLWWSIAILGLIVSLALIFLPGLLSPDMKTNIPPTQTISKPAETKKIESATPTAQSPVIGTKDNPIIWMYLPDDFLGFETVSAAADDVTAQFQAQHPDLTFKLIPALDNKTIVDALCDGEAHIGSLSAIPYLVVSERSCAKAVLLWSAYEDIDYSGMVITRTESNIGSIEELQGKTLCIPTKDSLSGYVLPSLEIRASIGNPEEFFGEIREVGSHPDVLNGVYENSCDVGTTYYDARKNSDLVDVMNKITILSTTPSIPRENLSFSNSIPLELSHTLIDFFLSASNASSSLATVCKIDTSQTSPKLIEINDYYYNGIRDLFTRAGEKPSNYLYAGQ